MGADFKVHAALTTPFGHDRLAGQGLAGLKDSTKSRERYREYIEVGRRHRSCV